MDQKAEPAGKAEKGFSTPTISLPKGGGAIRGIGEKLTANPVTGTGQLSVPLATSPGRSGFGPQLSLTYNSGFGNGPFGYGWSLSIPAITCKTDKGLPEYRQSEESDVYLLSGAEDLVPVREPDGSRFEDSTTAPGFLIHRYRPRTEGLFARIERWTHQATGETHWRSITRDNITSLYGKDNDSRIFDPTDPAPEHPGRIFSWLICQSYDDKGNAIVYEYAAENAENVDQTQAHERNRLRTANRYVKSIRYGNRVSRWIQPDLATMEWLFEVVFDYDEDHSEEIALDPGKPVDGQHRYVLASSSPGQPWTVRPDPFSSYRAGFEVRTYRRCRRVLMFHRFSELGSEPVLVRSTELDYADLDYSQPVTIEDELAHPGSTRIASVLRSITPAGFVRDGSRPVVQRGPLQYFTYLKKSLPPLELEYSRAVIQDDVRELDATSLENLPSGLDGAAYQWIDLDGEGVSGILTEQATAWFYKSSLGEGRFRPLRQVAPKPSLAHLGGGRQQLLDLAGDGQLDLVDFAGSTPGFYKRTADADWESFKAFDRVPSIAWDEPNLRFVDLDGDGHADVLITGDEVFTWYPSLAEEGFAPARKIPQPCDEEKGPRLVMADGSQSIYLADMSGDGLTDLVRIRNGEVCYWPNLGYGRFGAKVTLDGSPWFDDPSQFNQQRVRLADIDGSGTIDVIYLGRDGVRLYFNQSGNRLSPPRRLSGFPFADRLSGVMTADLLGNGTACLVWSSPLPQNARAPVRYIDLMGGQKPHLLIKASNHLGAETRVHYAPSTKFYLADKLAGTPWVTRIPFPVQVVERVETRDQVSGNLFVTRYAYHHGHFDGVEREFNGFGRVEQWDTEELAALHADQQLPSGTNVEATSHVPPVYTRRWFHTGLPRSRGRVSKVLQGEYYREAGSTDAQAKALLLDDVVLPEGLTLEEEREACRALKGSMLRQEVYALDGTAREKLPYTVTEQNFSLLRLQPKGVNRHGVFFAHLRESISYHHERSDPPDPRVTHALTLEVDDYGNVLKTAAVGYGRRQSDSNLETRDQDTQRAVLVTWTDNEMTNPVDGVNDHRTPLVSETRTWELTGLVLPAGQRRFTFDEVWTAGTTAEALEYGESLTEGALEKRLIEQVRTVYRRDDLSGPLLLGDLESLALPFESYRLAFTSGLAADVYAGRATDTTFADDGRYVHSEGDAQWWIPSGRVFYSPEPADTPAQELAWARAHFFLPLRARDPFHAALASTETSVRYDVYDLLPEETLDALGNRMTVGERHVDPALPLVQHGQDYRVLQPALVMDSNRNRSAVAFDALGMVAGTAVMGKPLPGAIEGDSLEGFDADLTAAVIDDHLANPLSDPLAILHRATTRLIYDLSAQPAVVYTLGRETHDAGLAPGEATRLQHGFSYSDGFGREIQKKLQAEPGPAPRRDAGGKILVGPDGQPEMTVSDVSPRWVGTGWTVFNNKGKPVRQYEPFFTDTHRFEFDVRIGVSPVLFYDPVERPIGTLHANHAWEKVVFDAWRQETWDVNDTVLVEDPKTDPDLGSFFRRLPAADYLPTWRALRDGGARGPEEQDAASKAAIHAETPAVAHFDPLGRSFLTIVHNRFKRSDALPDDPPEEELHSTRIVFDIEGNQRELRDAEDRVVMRYDYDITGRRIHQASMEAGERWELNDVADKSLYVWNSRDHRIRTAYDALRRPTGIFLADGAAPESLVVRTDYGEALPDPETANLRGKVVRLCDQAGLVTNEAYDFKGNLLRSARQLAQEYKQTIDWSAPVPLEPAVYVSRMSYDALNRPTVLETPDESVVHPLYNEANLLERVDVHLRGAAEATPFVTNIGYDAKGRRTRIDHGTADGAGISTTYLYDPETFRLTGLVTRRNAAGFDGADRPGEVQSLHYTYDPAGNVTHIRDDAQQTVYFLNRRVEPSADYTYDALYRLIEARGREHLGQTAGTPGAPTAPDAFNGFHTGLPHPGDGNAMGTYFESYVYDAVGNILSLQHRGSDPVHPGWTRAYAYDEVSQLEAGKVSNRLSGTTVGAMTETYDYDGPAGLHGNITAMPHLPLIQWDYRDQIQATARQVVGGGGTPETTWYVYDAGGRRVRKVTERAGTATRLKERIYVGRFEVYREYAGDGTTVDLERETLHVMDDQRRIALVETRTDVPAPQPSIRYQLGNHLGSASLELDDQAQVISYEEHYPYGSTSYQAVRSQSEAPKRYRYTGKERDEETGLADHGARYYAPWLGRWVNCDPAGLKDGLNPYLYVHANPVLFIDADGKEAKNPLWFREVVPAILQAAKKEGIPVKNAMLLIIWAYAEQAPIGPGNKPYVPSEHNNRLFNAQPTMKQRDAPRTDPPKEVERLCPGYASASCQVSTPRGAEAKIYNLTQLMDVTTGRQAPSPHFGFKDVYSGVVFTLQRIAGERIHPDVAPPSYGSINRLLRASGTTVAQFFDKHLDKWAFSGYAKKIIDDKIPETATRETKAYVLATIPKLEAKIKELTDKIAEAEKTIAESKDFIAKAKAAGVDTSGLEKNVQDLEEAKAKKASEKAGFQEHLDNFKEFKTAMGW